MANLANGEVVPTPTLPVFVMVIRSALAVTNRRKSSVPAVMYAVCAALMTPPSPCQTELSPNPSNWCVVTL